MTALIERVQFGIIKPSRGKQETDKNMSYKASVVIEKDEHGYYAYCPELDGCQTQGDSLEEVMANMKEALALYIETMEEEDIKERFSREILTTSMEVKVG